jgi:hypothetical protein
MTKKKIVGLIWTAVLTVSIAVSLSVNPRPTALAADQSRLEMEHALFTDRCSACHDLPKPETFSYTREEWQTTVQRMLTKYKASDEITTAEAEEIVDYLATFAPKPSDHPSTSDPWASEAGDVWVTAPTRSYITTFADADGLKPLTKAAAGEPGPAAVWRVRTDATVPVGSSLAVTQSADAGRFAMLIDKQANGRDIDSSVRFRSAGGSLGIAFGVQDPRDCYVVRYRASDDTLSLFQMNGQRHKAMQATPVSLTGPDTGWHTLRVMARAGNVRAWIDGEKRVSVQAPDYDGGAVALWVQGATTASFDNWTTDVYDKPQ